MPFFSPPYVVSCETQGKDTVCHEGCEGNVSSGNDVYAHSDLNETPRWEWGRHEPGNSKARLAFQGEQLLSDDL